MKCRKQIVLTGYRVQFVDLREAKPRTPQETIHVVDHQWLDALGLLGQNITGNIRDQYERAGYKVFAVEPPLFVELEITETEPGFKGDTATGATKPAVVETGATVYVPLFVNQNDVIKIDTRTGEYLSRV